MYLHVKRLIDIVLSLIGLVVLLPVFIIIAVVIKLDSPGPVFFRQKRVGKRNRRTNELSYFYILKFRTLKIDAPKDTPTHLLENPDMYISRSGRHLRRFSADELPQLINTLLPNQMSLIGPRPALWNQYDLIAGRDKYGANDVKPGLTGLAQINGRDELSIETKAWYDGEYVKKFGFVMDVKCFFGTLVCVLKKDGIVEGNVQAALDETAATEELAVK